MKDSNIHAFSRWICNKSWDDVLQQSNCNTKFDLFYDVLMKVINRYLPLRKQKTTLRDKPWLTNKLIKTVYFKKAIVAGKVWKTVTDV